MHSSGDFLPFFSCLNSACSGPPPPPHSPPAALLPPAGRLHNSRTQEQGEGAGEGQVVQASQRTTRRITVIVS